MPRIVRVLLRTKSLKAGVPQSAKVVTNCRVPERRKPIQIYLGSVSLIREGGIIEWQRNNMLENLRRRWLQHFKNDDVDVDWNDAERKLTTLRERTKAAAAAFLVQRPPMAPEAAPPVDRRSAAPDAQAQLDLASDVGDLAQGLDKTG